MNKKYGRTMVSGIAISSIIIASMISIAIHFQQNAVAQSSSNPLAKVPVIGQLMNQTKSSGNATTNSSSAGNTTSSSSNQSSNPLAKVPVIGNLLGGK
jgi:hypothetical protein